jgi:succinoglycan biosynthesis transport protein ExoP
MEERLRMDEREVELIDYLRIIWRQKWVIAVTLIVAVLTAWGVSQAIPPTYETQTSLLLLPPLSSQLDAEAVGSRLAPEAYQELAVSTSLLVLVREAAELEDSVDIEEFKEWFSVSVKRLTSEGELLLSTTIRGSDPDQLPGMAAAWTEAFADTYGELFQDRIARSHDYINQNYAETEAELGQLLEKRTNLLLDHPISALQAELNALQQEEIGNRARLVAARRELGTTAALVGALEQELSLQPFTHTLRRSIDPDSVIAALGAGLSAREIETLTNVQVESESLNETYLSLDSQIASNRAFLQQLEEEIRVREGSSASLQEELEKRRIELTEAEAKLDDYDRRIELLTSAHAKLTSSLQDAKIALAETPEPIRVIDEPLVPRYPIAPKKVTNMAIAGLLGLMLGTLLAFFADYLRRVREQESAPEQPHSSAELRDEDTNEEAQSRHTETGEELPSP